ncbi:hypothetical protein [Crocinitomix catalasitica]|uniref:hypothetical protein n=1 Tax=Crocinitomix catalasitica TaxID=184607 RepID=UPI0012FB340F|nr:hypothetical protein [Crocinitomix catalasitica]
MNKIFFFLIALLPFMVYGQNKGLAIFYVDQDNGYYEILINDTLLLKKHKDSLPTGSYKAKIWSSGYDVKEIKFDIQTNETTLNAITLVRSNDYKRYESDYKIYRMKFHKEFTLPITLSLAGSLTTAGIMLKTYGLQKSIRTNIEKYHASFSISEVEEIKADINDLSQRYNRNRVAYYISGGITTVLVAGTIYSGFRLRKHNDEPFFKETSPFEDRISYSISPFGGQLIFKL